MVDNLGIAFVVVLGTRVTVAFVVVLGTRVNVAFVVVALGRRVTVGCAVALGLRVHVFHNWAVTEVRSVLDEVTLVDSKHLVLAGSWAGSGNH